MDFLFSFQVCERMLLKAEEEVGLQFFSCFASEPLHKGSLKMKFGAIIGLPGTFAYKDVSDVKKDELLLDNRSVDWHSERGETLLKALILSDKAKAFAIAREINYAHSYHLHVETFLRSMFGVLAYTCGFMMNRSFRFNQRLRPWARFSVYSVVASVWFLLYILSADTYHCLRDNSADRKAATLNKLYAEGGVEYYTKLLARNQMIRTLMGSEGPKKYTAYGNVVSTWRRDHVQLTTRRDNLQSYLREYENS